MARGRPRRPDLTESWDEVDSDFDSQIFTHDDEKKELGSQYLSSQSTHAASQSFEEDEERMTRSRTPRRTRKSVKIDEPEDVEPELVNVARSEPQLVMPSSPNGLGITTSSKLRAQTPHFRLNQRSLTSDAGTLKREAAKKKGTKDRRGHPNDRDGIGSLLWQQLRPALSWILDIIRIALTNPIVKYALALWLIIGAFILVRNFATNSINHALSPLCRIPIVSWFQPPFCPQNVHGQIGGNTEFDKLMQAQEQFQDVLTESAQGAVLPLDMKRSEASIRDLRSVVQYSSIPSKNELVFEFGGFIDTARQASQDLSRFNVRIGNAVDRILSTNRWTLQVIEGVAAKDTTHGSLARLVENLNIFAPFQPMRLNRDVLVDQYLRHTTAVEEQVSTLIAEAQVLLGVLDNLDGRLEVIADIATRDGITVKEDKEALFAALWTKLGGNRNSVAKLDNQLQLLRDVGQYKKLAWAHVSGTIIKLQAIRDQLEDLRERVALPETVGSRVPLEVHIENINLGIDRLEQQRDVSKRIADENIARVLDRGSRSDRLIEARTVHAL